MKIRSGFVSNSSSSSFVVQVPEDFVISRNMLTDQVITELAYYEGLEDDDSVSQEVLDEMNSEIDRVKAGNALYNNYNSRWFMPLVVLLEEQDMVVMTLDGPGGDGEDVITPFRDKRKKK